jgi:pseudouridine synthase
MAERLQKLLSQWGIASRRQAEQLIREGRVQLNGAVAQIGQTADPQSDRIIVDGVLLQVQHRPQSLYLLLHKPAGVVSTCDDPQGRRTVLDLLPKAWQQNLGLHPVGRLDADSTGALLLTNDGDLTFQLTHPSHSIPKTYQVWVEGIPPEPVLCQWCQGVLLNNQKTRPAAIRVLKRSPQRQRTLLEIILKEGRNRQIRRIAEQLGYPVIKLHRTAIGPIQLRQLPAGQYRHLQPSELSALQRQYLTVPTNPKFFPEPQSETQYHLG